jgi:hypothetical protein
LASPKNQLATIFGISAYCGQTRKKAKMNGKSKAVKATNLINHVAFVIDGSGSMSGKQDAVIKVFDEQVKALALDSVATGQEFRVSVYIFNTDPMNRPVIRCIIYDKDVLRMPSIEGQYSPENGTPLIDGTLVAIRDLLATPQKYGDHAFLIYAQTDGEENASKESSSVLNDTIINLPGNFTVACLVPNQTGAFYAKRFGFPADNVEIWDATSSKGVEEAGAKMRATTSTWATNRANGVRGTKSLFKVDTANLNTKAVKTSLVKVPSGEYVILPVKSDATIRDFVESNGFTFKKGIAHYLLTKPENVQGYKGIYVFDRKTSSLYTGDNARQILGLPLSSAKVIPGDFSNFDIFIQSCSVNRRLISGTKLLIVE